MSRDRQRADAAEMAAFYDCPAMEVCGLCGEHEDRHIQSPRFPTLRSCPDGSGNSFTDRMQLGIMRRAAERKDAA